MSIECYFSACPNHDCHTNYPHPDMYAGPFCSQNDCTSNPMEAVKFGSARRSEFRNNPLTLIDDTFWYNYEGRLYVAGKIDYVNETVTVGFHDGMSYVNYVVKIDRPGLTLEMYLRQMMKIMHCFDVTTLYFTGE